MNQSIHMVRSQEEMPEKDPHALLAIWQQIGANIQVLGLSGIAGAFFRALFAPEGDTKRRVIQGIGGALSAIFLGGIMSHFINLISDAGVYAYLAAGFIAGSGGEAAVKAVQEKLYDSKKK